MIIDAKTCSIFNLDVFIAIVAITTSIALVGYTLVKGASPLYLVLGGLVATSSILWLARRRSWLSHGGLSEPIGPRSLRLLLSSTFFFVLTLSTLSIYFRPLTYERPWLYFILISLAFGIISIEAFFFKGRWSYLIVVQIVAVGLSLAWSPQSIFPSLLGSDPWYHQYFTLDMLKNAVIPAGETYSGLPFTQLLLGSTMLVCDLSFKASMMLTVGFLQIAMVATLIFLLAYYLTGNRTVSALAAMLSILGDYSIIFSWLAVPNSLALIFIPLIIYILISLRKRNPFTHTLLASFLMISLVLTHTITTLCLSMLLIIGWLVVALNGKRTGSDRPAFTLTLATFFTVIMLAWWSYGSDKLKFLMLMVSQNFSGSSGIAVYKPLVETITDGLGMAIFFAIAFFGLLYMLADRTSEHSRQYAIMSIVPLIVGTISTILGLFFVDSRWLLFAQVLLSIPGAIALVLFVHSSGKKKAAVPIIAAFITIIALLLILNSAASPDVQPLAPTTGIVQGLTVSEIVAFNAMGQRWDGAIGSDQMYSETIMHYARYNTNVIDDQLYSKDFNKSSTELVAIRHYVVNHAFLFKNGWFRIDYDPGPLLIAQDFSRIYASQSVGYYVKNP